MDFLDAVLANTVNFAERTCFSSRDESLTYGELGVRSRVLGEHFETMLGDDKRAIVVYGHKSPWMITCFLAAVRSGRPYIPVDSSFPVDRVTSIVSESDASLVIAAGCELPAAISGRQITTEELERMVGQPLEVAPALKPVGPDDAYYIIYTSGSTGRPKGVQISRASLASFTTWMTDLVDGAGSSGSMSGATAGAGAGSRGGGVLNQAPFSFDLSVMDMAVALATGRCWASLDRDHIARLGDLFAMLRASDLEIWVSTPSFADLCLSDPAFNDSLLPHLREFLFCGETLGSNTAAALIDRFPRARVVNTYGPTEATVAVTSIVIDQDVVQAHSILPVGAPKPGTHILIRDPDGQLLPEGQRGEVVIAGDTVSLGYYHRDDLNAVAFGMLDDAAGQVRTYRTGDAGMIQDGQLHFLGRLDFQIKLHGYRIEIEDIEANLRRLSDVRQTVVYPVEKAGQPGVFTHLEAVVQLDGEVPAAPLGTMVALKRRLREFVPDYMVPKIIHFVPEIPLTANGKADRRAARALM